jgi:DNA-binding FrmR family transcriptional regulator
VVTQVSAVTRALQEVAIGLLKDHLDCCVVEAVRRSDKDGKKAIEEVVSTLRQVVRL